MIELKCKNCKYFCRNIAGDRSYGDCKFIYYYDYTTLKNIGDDIAYIETWGDSGEESSGCLMVNENFFCKCFKPEHISDFNFDEYLKYLQECHLKLLECRDKLEEEGDISKVKEINKILEKGGINV
jgi:hypothetical protein